MTHLQETMRAENEHAGTRLGEILKVLQRHQIGKGLTPVKMREILEDLGPTYVKLGQIMSMRSDVLPEEYCRELTSLRTQVRPVEFHQMKDLLEQELGAPVSQVFSSLDEKPLGSASIAQVHRGRLQSGEEVVVKIQRPNIHEIMAEDIALMRKAAGMMNLAMQTKDIVDFRSIIEEMWKTTQEEMDFQKEAANLELFAENQKDIVYITSPKVYREYTTSKVLTMSYIGGLQIDRLEELRALGYDNTEIGQKAAENYCKQILEDGFFHADPHPGNLWIENGKIAWLDFGMTGRLSEGMKHILKNAIMAILQNDIYSLKNTFLALGTPKNPVNHAQLYTDLDDIVRRYLSMDFGTMNLGNLLEELLDMLKTHEISIPSDITMLCRSMMTMEGTLKACSPNVNLIQILSIHMSQSIWKELDLKHELRHNARLIYMSSAKALEIPAQLSDLLNIVKNGQVRINLQENEGRQWRKSIYAIANRLTLSLLSAAMLLASAIFSFTDIHPQILGMPWISFLFLIISGILILYLLIIILLKR